MSPRFHINVSRCLNERGHKAYHGECCDDAEPITLTVAVDDQEGDSDVEVQDSNNKVCQPRCEDELCKSDIDYATEMKLLRPHVLALLARDIGHIHYDKHDTGENKKHRSQQVKQCFSLV